MRPHEVGDDRVSVVIAARDEEAVIGRCLHALLEDAAPGELEIVVVANGCRDRTAAVAAAFGDDVRVVTTPVASKTAAYNLGDEVATAFPRFYVDADVELRTDAVRAVAEVLRAREALAAAPRLRLALAGAPWAVRAYFRIWTKLPYVVDDLIGSGVFALSAEGRRRFATFPDVIADDLFVRSLFVSGERRSVSSQEFVVYPPRRVGELIRRKSRVFFGNAQYRRRFEGGRRRLRRAEERWYHLVVRRPALAREALPYVAITVLARGRAAWKRVRRDSTWDRDESSRRALRPATARARPGPTRGRWGAASRRR